MGGASTGLCCVRMNARKPVFLVFLTCPCSLLLRSFGMGTYPTQHHIQLRPGGTGGFHVALQRAECAEDDMPDVLEALTSHKLKCVHISVVGGGQVGPPTWPPVVPSQNEHFGGHEQHILGRYFRR